LSLHQLFLFFQLVYLLEFVQIEKFEEI
ncbi:hypothetical protein LCGC14_1397890, partial [marine sediment metagenome]